MRRIGVFGGTFDPPHLGHVALAECAREQLDLDRVLFVPAGDPPHKRGRALSPAAARVAMTRLAIEDRPGFKVLLAEVRRPGPSFTVDTLRAIHRAHPRAELFLILGEDSLEEFGTWREPAAIRKLATLVVARRPGSRARRGRGVVWLDNPLVDLSSSGIRARARAGRPVRALVPAPVARYMLKHRLYRGRA
jgi:nicotinate-nucleotide adenylyltransferase